jgi:hypothetical protein
MKSYEHLLVHEYATRFSEYSLRPAHLNAVVSEPDLSYITAELISLCPTLTLTLDVELSASRSGLITLKERAP